MKYSYFDNVTNKKVTVSIPDNYIETNCRNLNISTQEAIDMWLSDEGYVLNEVVEELTAKAKDNPIDRDIVRKSRKAPQRKPDYEKQSIMRALENALHKDEELNELSNLKNIELANIERILSFCIGENEYIITLTRRRKSKSQ